MADKYINAGLKTYAEAVQRLEGGETFYLLDSLRVSFDSSHENPFVITDSNGKKSGLNNLWKELKNWDVLNPYYELQKAHGAGETIEVKDDYGTWMVMDYIPEWDLPPERYRIKPEKTKLYLWAVKPSKGGTWITTSTFYKDEKALADVFVFHECVRLDYTMIEVDE